MMLKRFWVRRKYRTVEEVVNSPSIQREFSRVRSLNGRIEIEGNNVVIHRGVIPLSIANAFMGRIKEADLENCLVITVAE